MPHSEAKQIENFCIKRIHRLGEGTKNPEFKITSDFVSQRSLCILKSKVF